MAPRYRIIHCLNQFFGGLGGEEKASLPPQLFNGARGPGILLGKLFPDLEVAASLVFGDNYLAENRENAGDEISTLLAPLLEDQGDDRIHLLIAGPAFNGGRYGLACITICRTVTEHFNLPAVTSMYPENPAAAEDRKGLFIARGGENVMAMEEDLKNMAGLALKLLRGQELLPERDGYLPRGIRKNYFSDKSGAERAVDLLLLKLGGKPFSTEYRMPVFDRVQPAPPVDELKKARLALVTSGGIVPHGNPDRIEAANASRFGAYSLEGLTAFNGESHQSAHGGYDPTYANADPNRVLPLDVLRDLESEGVIGSLHHTYYATVGNGTSVANARRYGSEIAKRLVADGVQAVILTST